MASLELGLGLFPTEPPQRIVETVRLAEDLGYSHVWIGDSQSIWREAYVNLGAAGLATRRVVLGTGVTNPLTRHLAVTASAWATLSELTGGRVALGIGAGDSALETLGLRPARLARLEEYIRAFRRLVAGEEVELETGRVRITWAAVPPVPVVVAGSGPRILRLAGRVADGAIILAGTAPELVRAAIACVREGAQEAGRDLEAEGFRLVLWAPCSISADGQAAREYAKSHVARVLKRPLPFALAPDDQAVVEEIYRTYEYYQHMVVGAEHSSPVPDRLVPKFAIAGTAEQCHEQVRGLLGLGLHQIALVPHTPDPRGRQEVIRVFAREVMAGL